MRALRVASGERQAVSRRPRSSRLAARARSRLTNEKNERLLTVYVSTGHYCGKIMRNLVFTQFISCLIRTYCKSIWTIYEANSSHLKLLVKCATSDGYTHCKIPMISQLPYICSKGFFARLSFGGPNFWRGSLLEGILHLKMSLT